MDHQPHQSCTSTGIDFGYKLICEIEDVFAFDKPVHLALPTSALGSAVQSIIILDRSAGRNLALDQSLASFSWTITWRSEIEWAIQAKKDGSGALPEPTAWVRRVKPFDTQAPQHSATSRASYASRCRAARNHRSHAERERRLGRDDRRPCARRLGDGDASAHARRWPHDRGRACQDHRSARAAADAYAAFTK